jgi:hypothetical protein
MHAIQDFLQQIINNFNLNQSYIGIIIIAISIIIILLSVSYLFVKNKQIQIIIKLVLNFFITSSLIIIYSLLSILNHKITTIDTINLGVNLNVKNLDFKMVLLIFIVLFLLYELKYLKQYLFDMNKNM